MIYGGPVAARTPEPPYAAVIAKTNAPGIWLLIPWCSAWGAPVAALVTGELSAAVGGAAVGAVAGFVGAAVLVLLYGRNRIEAVAEGLVAVTRGSRTAPVGWDDIASSAWEDEWFWFSRVPSGGGVAVRLHGMRHDDADVRVGSVLLLTPRRRRKVPAAALAYVEDRCRATPPR